jgi:hypothetical protein
VSQILFRSPFLVTKQPESEADFSAAMMKTALRYIELILTTDPPVSYGVSNDAERVNPKVLNDELSHDDDSITENFWQFLKRYIIFPYSRFANVVIIVLLPHR